MRERETFCGGRRKRERQFFRNMAMHRTEKSPLAPSPLPNTSSQNNCENRTVTFTGIFIFKINCARTCVYFIFPSHDICIQNACCTVNVLTVLSNSLYIPSTVECMAHVSFVIEKGTFAKILHRFSTKIMMPSWCV